MASTTWLLIPPESHSVYRLGSPLDRNLQYPARDESSPAGNANTRVKGIIYRQACRVASNLPSFFAWMSRWDHFETMRYSRLRTG
ncbi:MAG: hypothetical protein KatS3mg113_0552 [Planctomycetaceae bacterium]|nr:MAG: hypothetical protein KatS3mg113_0552 [Planctomycetaceae bacterium]